MDGGKLYFLYFGKTGRQRHTSQKERKYTVNHGKYGLQPNPPLRATIDPNYQKRFSQSLIVEISRKRAPLESDREHFWGIHFYNFPLFSSLLQVDLLASGASLVWPRPLTSWSALDLCTFAYPSKDTTDFESLFE